MGTVFTGRNSKHRTGLFSNMLHKNTQECTKDFTGLFRHYTTEQNQLHRNTEMHCTGLYRNTLIGVVALYITVLFHMYYAFIIIITITG